MSNLAEIAVAQDRAKDLETENKILKSQLAARDKIIAKMDGSNITPLAMEALNLRQREQLRQHSDALWRRKQAIRKLNERIQEIYDSVPAAAKWRDDRRAAKKEGAAWEAAAERARD
jgi:hypothetical protein